ncbi:hypothetical protein LEM8419_01158 [Neolewinella maritima]|uniref:Uncharacterized protein n=1 Tax=Neolewinella maritima TaxID=1383882 RepID=A0ABM9AZ23_9BACT|nr:hypothetical protein [Neolewinella maritima]CAH0999901.1 hypothetical protein LEM8419_01158 [Neolewinella maritima]
MIRTLVKLGLLVVVTLLAYNYFLGTPEEKASSREIVGKVRELGSDAWQLLRSERTKLKEGKYDDALDRLESLYANLKEVAVTTRDSETLQRLEELGQRREAIEDRLRGSEDLDAKEQQQLDELTSDTEDLMHEMEAKGQSPAPY